MVATLGDNILYVTTRMVAMLGLRGEKSILLKLLKNGLFCVLRAVLLLEAKAETVGTTQGE